MFWQEEAPERDIPVPDDIIDLQFAIAGRRIPVDHAHALSVAVRTALPAGLKDAEVGVHSIHVAGSQNGWERPAHDRDNHLMLSRRTKLVIRVPKAWVAAIEEALTGQTLDIADCPLTVGAGKERLLSKETTLFARYVVDPCDGDEQGFLEWAVAELRSRGATVRKALCGKTTPLSTPDGSLTTRSLLIADLSVADSLLLQQGGIGPRRDMGCGIFIPHKGIEAVPRR